MASSKYHQPEPADVGQSLFSRTLNLVEGINAKMGVGARKTAAETPEVVPTSAPTAGPKPPALGMPSPTLGNVLGDFASGLGKILGLGSKTSKETPAPPGSAAPEGDQDASLGGSLRRLLGNSLGSIGKMMGVATGPPATKGGTEPVTGGNKATPTTVTPSPAPTNGPPPQRQQSFADIMMAWFGRIGQNLGIETRAQATKRIDLAQEEAEAKVARLQRLLAKAQRSGTLDEEKVAKRKLAQAQRELHQTIAVVPQGANVDWQQFGHGMRRFVHGLQGGHHTHHLGFAGGGVVPGGKAPGPTDTVPAMLSPGEVVLSREMVGKLGEPFLARVKAGQVPLGFAGGGQVPGGQGLSAGQAIGKGVDIVANAGAAMAGDPAAIGRVLKDGFDLFVDNVKAFGRHVADLGKSADKMMMSDRLEDQAMGAIEGQEAASKLGARGVANVIGGPLGGAILGPIMEKMTEMNPVIMFEKALVGTIATIRKWNDHLHEANMNFAQFSAGMAAVQARQQFRDIMLSRERGERRAPSAEGLAESRHEINQRLAVFEDAFAVVKNQGMTMLNQLVVRAMDWAELIMPLRTFLENWMPKPEMGPLELELTRRQHEEYMRRIRERRRGG